jgi:hypothetical protein
MDHRDWCRDVFRSQFGRMEVVCFLRESVLFKHIQAGGKGVGDFFLKFNDLIHLGGFMSPFSGSNQP